ncbi:hypothetical protein [Desemzia sp. FAM 24101]|uniref:hypothetical protein n=1 Tax=unclassified Desemzia TaxID=2685243 RepID=UPI003889F34D
MDDKLDRKGLIIINGSMCFTDIEREELQQVFELNNMNILFLEQRGIQNSIFDGIEIILNNNLFNLVAGGLLMPAAYDALKKGLVFVIKKIKYSNAKILRANKDLEQTNIVIKIKTDNGEIIASINRELSEKEVEEYIQAMIAASKIIKGTDKKDYYYIIDKNTDDSLEILSLSSYLKKHNKI